MEGMFYRVSRLKFDGFCQYYAYDTELIYALNKDEAIRVYKTLHRVYGRQKVDVKEISIIELMSTGKRYKIYDYRNL